jgi:hypothetical protein
MAVPNLANVTTITPANSQVYLTTTNATSLASNAASSGTVLKIESLVVSNNDATTAYVVTINTYSAAALGGTAYPIISTLSVPANSSVIVIDKTNTIYLNENQSLGATAGTANKINVNTSFEVMS